MTNSTCDWSCHSPSFLLGWGVPVLALFLSASLAPPWMPPVWPAAFAWMGIACLVNAARCGRVHCYFTGVFFLIMAMASVLHGFELIDLGDSAWSWIGIISLVGAVALTVLPELILGRYRGPGASRPSHS